MFLKAVVFCLCAAYVASEEFVNSTDCGEAFSHHSVNVSMEVSGCSLDMAACPLVKGTNHSVAIYFTPTENFTANYHSKVFGVFPRFSVPHGRFSDACENSEAFNSTETCQSLGGFLDGVQYIRRSIFGLQPNYPSLSLKVRFVIQERKTKRVVMCQEIPVVLVDHAPVLIETNEIDVPE